MHGILRTALLARCTISMKATRS
eukprot:COSAG01_NODE_24673_length_771_cov_0.630952_1_plen_22_part_01